MDLRAENRRLRGELAVAHNKIGDLRVEILRLRECAQSAGVPIGCTIIPLSEADMEMLLAAHGEAL